MLQTVFLYQKVLLWITFEIGFLTKSKKGEQTLNNLTKFDIFCNLIFDKILFILSGQLYVIGKNFDDG